MRTPIAIVLILSLVVVQAQSSGSGEHKLGIKTSFNLSMLLGDALENPRPKFGYTAGAYYHINQKKKWSTYTEFTGSFRGSRFSNGDTDYSKIALFYLDIAAMPTYKIAEKKKISFGPYFSYLGLSSVFVGQKKQAHVNDIGARPTDTGLGIYYTIEGPIVGFQIGGKFGLINANQQLNFEENSPQTEISGSVHNFSLEIGMLF